MVEEIIEIQIRIIIIIMMPILVMEDLIEKMTLTKLMKIKDIGEIIEVIMKKVENQILKLQKNLMIIITEDKRKMIKKIKL